MKSPKIKTARDIAHQAIYQMPDTRAGYVALIAEILIIGAFENDFDVAALGREAIREAMGERRQE